jgi:hypothetical protein
MEIIEKRGWGVAARGRGDGGIKGGGEGFCFENHDRGLMGGI